MEGIVDNMTDKGLSKDNEDFGVDIAIRRKLSWLYKFQKKTGEC